MESSPNSEERDWDILGYRLIEFAGMCLSVFCRKGLIDSMQQGKHNKLTARMTRYSEYSEYCTEYGYWDVEEKKVNTAVFWLAEQAAGGGGEPNPTEEELRPSGFPAIPQTSE